VGQSPFELLQVVEAALVNLGRQNVSGQHVTIVEALESLREAMRPYSDIETEMIKRGRDLGEAEATALAVLRYFELVDAVRPLAEYCKQVEERMGRIGAPMGDAAFAPGDITQNVCMGTLRQIARLADMSDTGDEVAGAWMQTWSGAAFNPFTPRVEDVCIEDIAHALAHQCRYAGHCKQFYSVAEHSVRVSYACTPEDALWGLMHDAAEAYLVDLPRPVKRLMPQYSVFEDCVLEVIVRKFGLVPNEMPPSVKEADMVVGATEKRDLMGEFGLDWGPLPAPLAEEIRPWSPGVARARFMARFDELREWQEWEEGQTE
jgi:5'-deoxynucleotidase YfbR-like HD superfamily hydrolase